MVRAAYLYRMGEFRSSFGKYRGKGSLFSRRALLFPAGTISNPNKILYALDSNSLPLDRNIVSARVPEKMARHGRMVETTNLPISRGFTFNFDVVMQA